MSLRCTATAAALAASLAALAAVGAPDDAAAETPALRVTKSRLRLNPALARAYAAFNAADLATAEREYARVLASEPGNADALHGAAMVALRRGDDEGADALYRRALAANPRDAIASAGLIGMRLPADAAAAESRLKSRIAAQPDQPSLRFALGNVYAAGGRWREAQQAFSSACAGAPEQPDYLFNLAVSLDHLGQTRTARTFYERALSAARRRPAGFAPEAAAARVRALGAR